MTGQGIGISLSGSVRLEQAFSKSLGMAIEGGYAWQEVRGIEGPGSETIDGVYRTFEGEWGLVREDITIPWGTATFWFPTNDWAQFGQESAKFILDLSGFYASIGFYIRL
jgi:hypothetical protein